MSSTIGMKTSLDRRVTMGEVGSCDFAPLALDATDFFDNFCISRDFLALNLHQREIRSERNVV